jgi:hypothetical protein
MLRVEIAIAKILNDLCFAESIAEDANSKGNSCPAMTSSADFSIKLFE